LYKFSLCYELYLPLLKHSSSLSSSSLDQVCHSTNLQFVTNYIPTTMHPSCL